jgi:predicted amidohydrolase YtcJ
LGLHAAVTRQRQDGSPGPEGWYPEQRLSLQEALHGYTQGAAYAAGMEGSLGKLVPGYLADLLILNTDIFNCKPGDLPEIKPLATMVAGEWKFSDLDLSGSDASGARPPLEP